MKNDNFWQRLTHWQNAILGVLGFITAIVGFVGFAQGNLGLVAWTLIGAASALVLYACVHYGYFWRPEKYDQSPSGFQPAPTSEQEVAQARKVKRRKIVRWFARLGPLLLLLLVMTGYFGWQHVQSLPSQTVTILVADFEGPEPQNYRVTERIFSKLQDATEEYSDVKVLALGETITAQAGSETARDEGEKRKASIVIWGWYGKTADAVPISANFEVLQSYNSLPKFEEPVGGAVKTFAAAELESLQLQTELSSEMAYLTLFTLGVARFAVEDWENALTRFTAAVQNLETDAQSLYTSITHFYRGLTLHQLERYEKAIAAYDTALKLQSNFPFALVGKGDALYELARFEDAITAYDTALQLQPDLPFVLSNKGNALSSLGRYEEALAAAILNLAKSCSSPRNAGMVMTTEQPNRARTSERPGTV